MSDILERLRQDHTNVGFMLGLLERHIGRVHDQAPADFELMRDVMVYMTAYPDAVHHPLEDFVFDRVRHRLDGDRTDPRLEVFAVLRREHEALAEKGQRFRTMLEGVVDGALVERADLERSGRDYVEFLRHHMRVEDSEAFPIAAGVLSPADWRFVAERFELGKDPVFGPVVESEFESLLAHIERESRG